MANNRVDLASDQESSRQRNSTKYKPGSISPGPRACVACHKSEHLSELVGVCCRNCSIALDPLDEGLEIQTEGPAPAPAPACAATASRNPTRNPILNFASVIANLARQAPRSIKSIVDFLLPYFYFLIFHRLPSYHASYAFALSTLLDQSRSDYEQCVGAGGIELHKAWEDYLQAYLDWWKILLMVACASPSIPPVVLASLGTKDDPISKYFVYLAVYCSLYGVLLNLIFLQSARRCRGNLTCAFVWAKEAKKPDSAIWRMIALPDVVAFWTTISIFVAVFIVMWRDDSLQTPNAGNTRLVGRMSVTCMVLIDGGCALWAIKYHMKLIGEVAGGGCQGDAERGL